MSAVALRSALRTAQVDDSVTPDAAGAHQACLGLATVDFRMDGCAPRTTQRNDLIASHALNAHHPRPGHTARTLASGVTRPFDPRPGHTARTLASGATRPLTERNDLGTPHVGRSDDSCLCTTRTGTRHLFFLSLRRSPRKRGKFFFLKRSLVVFSEKAPLGFFGEKDRLTWAAAPRRSWQHRTLRVGRP